jgi:Heterokaryon incompatibility protein Het-C
MIISKIPGLEALLDKIIERVTLFALSLLAPFVIPIINAISKSLKTGSSTIVDASGKSQFQVWEQPNCSDPTHSMLSKDHFSNTLNEPAGKVASAILQYVVPRVIYAMEHPDVPVAQVHDDVLRVFHHPALRDPHLEIHRTMFSVVEQWVQERPGRGSDLDHLLGSESVKAGKNHHGGNQEQGHSHGGLFSSQSIPGFGSHSKVSGSPFEMFTKKRELDFAEEPLPDTAGLEHYSQGQYPQASYGQPASSYVPQAGYAQQSFQPQGGGPPASDPYAYSVGTSYQQGYNDGGYQQQQQPQQQPQQHPPRPGQSGTYGQPYGEQYPSAQQGPYGKY